MITHLTPSLLGQTLLMANTDSIADAEEVLGSPSPTSYRRSRTTGGTDSDITGRNLLRLHDPYGRPRRRSPQVLSARRGCSVALDPLARPVRNGRDSHDGGELR